MSAIVVFSSLEHQCVTFVWPDDQRYYVGYRFVEHLPVITSNVLHRPASSQPKPPPPETNTLMPRQASWLDNWQSAFSDPEDPLQFRFQTFSDGSASVSVVENDGLQERFWRFVPEVGGIRIWMTLKTHEPIEGGYIVQQCARFSSGIGSDFRKTVAHVPYLSELLMQALGNANGTITWARSAGKWTQFPVPFTRYHTSAGSGVFVDSSGLIDCGLIVRETASRERAPASYWRLVAPNSGWETWSAGMYWDRAVYVTNRHPADSF